MTGAPPLKLASIFLWVYSVVCESETWVSGDSLTILFNPNDQLSAKTLFLFNATSIFAFSIYYFDMS